MKKIKLNWSDDLSVGVVEIDNQHKLMIETINDLVEILNTSLSVEALSEIIKRLVEYKKYHFKTEEEYFEKYAFEGADEHKKEHQKFEESLVELQKNSNGDTVLFAFELVDFLEDWLVNHLMTMDKKYVECFKKAGLK